MLGFDPHLPIARTGEFPGFVNPRDPVGGESLVVIGTDDEVLDDEVLDEKPRRGRRPAPPVDRS